MIRDASEGEAEALRRACRTPPSSLLESQTAQAESLPLPGPHNSAKAIANDQEPRTQADEPLPKRDKPLREKRLSAKRGLLFWVLLSFLLRLFVVLRFEQVISPDGVEYVALARGLIAGHLREGLSTYWSPLYPLLVGISSLFFHDLEFAGRFVSVVAGSLLVIPSYRLIRGWYGERVALLGACLVSLHPLLIYYSTVLLTESTYTLLFTCGVLAGWSALYGRQARAFLRAGLTFGACYLLKPEAAGFLLLLLIPTLGRKLFDRADSLTRAARNVLFLCAGFLLPAAPYLFYLRQQTGSWMLSGKAAGHLWQGSRLAGGDITPIAAPLVPDISTALVQLTKALRFEYEIFNLIFPPVFVLLVGLGLFRQSWKSGRAWRELYLFSFVAAALAGYAVTLPNIRFIVPLLPLLLCWLAKGVAEFAGWAVETLARARGARRCLPFVKKIITPLVVAGLLASLVPLFVYLLRGDKWGDYYGQKRAALWIREHVSSRSPVIMATVPVAAFYAEGRHVELKEEDYQALITRARREGVDYLVVNERDFRYMSLLRALLDEQSIHPGLRLAHSLSIASGHKILVYAVDRTEESEPERSVGS
jgi:hypothetical protein